MRRARPRLLAWAYAVALSLAGSAAAWVSHAPGAAAVTGLRSEYVKRLLDEQERIILVDLRRTAEARGVLDRQCPREDTISAFVFLSRHELGLVGLRLDQVQFTGRYVGVPVRGKRRRERAPTLWTSVGDTIRAWPAVRGEVPTEAPASFSVTLAYEGDRELDKRLML